MTTRDATPSLFASIDPDEIDDDIEPTNEPTSETTSEPTSEPVDVELRAAKRGECRVCGERAKDGEEYKTVHNPSRH